LPYIEQAALWSKIIAPVTVAGGTYPPFGSYPLQQEYTPYQTKITNLLCPSDSMGWQPAGGLGKCNYNMSVGDEAGDVADGFGRSDVRHRGLFAGQWAYLGLRDVLDGTSNTVALSEFVLDRGNYKLGGRAYAASLAGLGVGSGVAPLPCLAMAQPDGTLGANYKGGGPGFVWAFGGTPYTFFSTMLPPNSPYCNGSATCTWERCGGVYSAQSYHPGGVNVCLADASCRFIAETIDTGDLSRAPPQPLDPSPYGVWGALGSRAAGEAKALP
jgi:hypothetical protein